MSAARLLVARLSVVRRHMSRMRTVPLVVSAALAAAFAAALSVGACSSAMRIQRAPGLGKNPFHRVVVAVGIDELPLRQLAEDSFAVERVTEADIIPSVQLMKAGRGYEPDELSRELTRAGADAVAIIAVSGAGMTNIELQPLGIQSSCVSRSGSICRRPAPMLASKGEPHSWASFRVDVYAMATAQLMWTAEVRTNGIKDEQMPQILRRLAHDVVQAWQKDGVVSKPAVR